MNQSNNICLWHRELCQRPQKCSKDGVLDTGSSAVCTVSLLFTQFLFVTLIIP